MPETQAFFFAKDDGSAPLLDWLDQLPTKVQDKCIVRIERLKRLGYELRRPNADQLRDGIYELRVRYGHVNYRILYFFHKGCAVISHGFIKKDVVPQREIELALARKAKFEQNPVKHTYKE